MATHFDVRDVLKFEIDPQPGESLRACEAIAKRVLPPSGQPELLFGLYVIAMLSGFVLVPSARFTAGLIALLAVVATAVVLPLSGRRRLARLQANDPHATERHFVELSAAGVHTWCSHVNSRYGWADFREAAEDKEFYLLVRPSGAGVAIPKRVLDEARAEELRARLREWSPDRGANLGSHESASVNRPSN
jgi:hypothetical protein